MKTKRDMEVEKLALIVGMKEVLKHKDLHPADRSMIRSVMDRMEGHVQKSLQTRLGRT